MIYFSRSNPDEIIMLKRAIIIENSRRLKRRINSLREHILSLTEIPREILNPDTDDIEGFKKWLCASEAFTFQQDELARSLIDVQHFNPGFF